MDFMKINGTKLFFMGLICFLCSSVSFGFSLTAKELEQSHELGLFLDKKPVRADLQRCIDLSNTESMFVRNLAMAVLMRHHPMGIRIAFGRSLALDGKAGGFEQSKPTLVLLSNLSKLLESYAGTLKSFKDERVKTFFLFHYFREKNIILIGDYKERLSLAGFYRQSFLSSVFADEKQVEMLLKIADK
jgi:hypothetical protein